MEYFKYIENQCRVPNYLVELALDQVENSQQLFVKDGDLYDLDFYSYAAPEELISWLKNSYPFLRPLSACYFNIQEIGCRVPIHSDRNRYSALNYLISTGGDNVETKWYTLGEREVYSTVIEPCRWHILNTKIKHGVSNINPDIKRISISVDLQKPDQSQGECDIDPDHIH